MTDDIVERLRWCPEYGGWSHAVVLMPEAANEIERLREVVVKVAATDHELHPDWKPLVEEARRACGPKP